MTENSTGGSLPRAALAAGLFIPLLVLLLLQIKSEGMQIAVALLAAFGFGYVIGHLVRGRQRLTYTLFGAATGLTTWGVIVLSAVVFYPGAVAYPLWTWFVRFGVGVALCVIGGSLFGDLVARQRFTVTTAFTASVVTIAGGLVTIFSTISSGTP